MLAAKALKGNFAPRVRWLCIAYAAYWASVALTAALALLGHPIVSPDAAAESVRRAASMPYEQRLAGALADAILVSAASYPALLYLAAVYGALTTALAGAFGALRALLYAAAIQALLFVMAQVSAWHPLVQHFTKRGAINWRRYLAWVAALFSLAGILVI